MESEIIISSLLWRLYKQEEFICYFITWGIVPLKIAILMGLEYSTCACPSCRVLCACQCLRVGMQIHVFLEVCVCVCAHLCTCMHVYVNICLGSLLSFSFGDSTSFRLHYHNLRLAIMLCIQLVLNKCLLNNWSMRCIISKCGEYCPFIPIIILKHLWNECLLCA